MWPATGGGDGRGNSPTPPIARESAVRSFGAINDLQRRVLVPRVFFLMVPVTLRPWLANRADAVRPLRLPRAAT